MGNDPASECFRMVGPRHDLVVKMMSMRKEEGVSRQIVIRAQKEPAV
jgi:hypothetical protein